MVASLLIIAFSLVLLAYWFRYTCLLLLSNSGTSAAASFQEDPRLNYRQVQDDLKTTSGAALDRLQRALDRDYAVLTYVLQHASGMNLNPVERHLLTTDYRVMGFWYRMARLFFPSAARGALEEMALVVEILSCRMGSQSAS